MEMCPKLVDLSENFSAKVDIHKIDPWSKAMPGGQFSWTEVISKLLQEMSPPRHGSNDNSGSVVAVAELGGRRFTLIPQEDSR
jgi:hypothetical protein